MTIAQAIYDAANDEGTVSASDALRLCRLAGVEDPRLHTTQSMGRLAAGLGVERELADLCESLTGIPGDPDDIDADGEAYA